MVVYREHPVPEALRPVIACGWTLTVSGAPVRGWRVLPDAQIDLVASGGPVRLAGPASTVQFADLEVGGVAGVRLRPGSSAALLGIPAHAIRDAAPALAELWPRDEAVARADAVAADPAAAPEARLRALYVLLAGRLRDAGAPDLLVRRAVATVERSAPSVTALADAAGLTSRQLLRRFDAAVGLGPKKLQRIVRLQRGLEAHRRTPDLPLAGLAATAGYADQAHLTRDWAALTGTTPAALLASRRVTVAG